MVNAMELPCQISQHRLERENRAPRDFLPTIHRETPYVPVRRHSSRDVSESLFPGYPFPFLASSDRRGSPRGDPLDPFRWSIRGPLQTLVTDIQPQFRFEKPGKYRKKIPPESTDAEDNKAECRLPLPRRLSSSLGFDKILGSRRRCSDSSIPIRSSEGSSTQTVSFSSKERATSFEQKYGRPGQVVGSGSSASVRVVERLEDHHLYAVKEYKPRKSHETQKEYNKKIAAEFCIASVMHHPNIIETLEVIQADTTWYQIMEYAPHDMLTIAMKANMSRKELFCCYKQLLCGVEYLHSMGLAHRDLKLENLVLTADGIVKIIDFGSAVVFRYPFEATNREVSGIAGSAPYAPPEIYSRLNYCPARVDVWSCAIIFCCLWMRRFPWKLARNLDQSFKSFTDGPNIPKLGFRELSSWPTITRETIQNDPALEQIQGRWRLLRMVPREVRPLISDMLETDPDKRVQINNPSVKEFTEVGQVCHVDLDTGRLYQALNHSHSHGPGLLR